MTRKKYIRFAAILLVFLLSIGFLSSDLIMPAYAINAEANKLPVQDARDYIKTVNDGTKMEENADLTINPIPFVSTMEWVLDPGVDLGSNVYNAGSINDWKINNWSVDLYAMLPIEKARSYDGKIHILIHDAITTDGGHYALYETFHFSQPADENLAAYAPYKDHTYVTFGSTCWVQGVSHWFAGTSYEVEVRVVKAGTTEPVVGDYRIALGDIDACQFYGLSTNNGTYEIYAENDSRVYAVGKTDVGTSTGGTNGYWWFYDGNSSSFGSDNERDSMVMVRYQNTSGFSVIVGSDYDVWSYSKHFTYDSNVSLGRWAGTGVSNTSTLWDAGEKFQYRSTYNSLAGGWAFYNGWDFGPGTPTIKKDVTGGGLTRVTSTELEENEMTFTYGIEFRIPDTHPDYYYKNFYISDQIPSEVTATGVKLYIGTGSDKTDVTSSYIASGSVTTGNNLKVNLNPTALTSGAVNGKTFRMEVTCQAVSMVDDVKIYNTAHLHGEYASSPADDIDSNPVDVILHITEEPPEPDA